MKQTRTVRVGKGSRTRFGRKETIRPYSYERATITASARSVQLPYFCPKCGSLYIVKKRKGETYAYCPRCQEYVPLEEVNPTVTQVKQDIQPAEMTIIYEDVPLSLKAGKGDPKCKHVWTYVTRQTRSGDEGSTTWSICTKCGKVVKGYVPNSR